MKTSTTKLNAQGCKSLLSIGGIICHFTPILPYFQHWGDEPRPRFFSGKQMKRRAKKRSSPEIKHVFTPNSSVDQKKRASPKMEHLFSPNSSGDLRSDARQSQIIGGNADVDHTQIIGGIYPPHPPRVSAPL